VILITAEDNIYTKQYILLSLYIQTPLKCIHA